MMLALTPLFFASSLISSSLAATISVDVGNGGLLFTPNQVTAQEGDEIIFNFYPKNHSVVQSTLAEPCAPLTGGGTTGFVPVAAGTTDNPTRKLVVPSSTAPLWFYCSQANHCSQGMVFAINPGEKMDQFLANAKGGGDGGATTSAPPASTTNPASTTTTADPTASTPPTGGTNGSGRTIAVDVGANGLTFSPEQVTASVGDTIVWTFKGGAHTATQSTFASPCSPFTGGFDSGPQPAAGLTTGFPTYNFTVTDASKPIWVYCKTGTHCSASGMVFSINAPATGNTHAAFKQAAIGGGSNTTAPPPGNSAPSLVSVNGASSLLFAVAIAGLLL